MNFFLLLLLGLKFQLGVPTSFDSAIFNQKFNESMTKCAGIFKPGYGCNFHCPYGTTRVYDRFCEKTFLRCCHFPEGPCHGKDHFCVNKPPSHWKGCVTKSCPDFRKPKCCIRQPYSPSVIKPTIDLNKWLHVLFPFWYPKQL